MSCTCIDNDILVAYLTEALGQAKREGHALGDSLWQATEQFKFLRESRLSSNENKTLKLQLFASLVKTFLELDSVHTASYRKT